MTAGPEPVDPVECLLEECLGAPDARRQDALDRLCCEHPEHADDLRGRYRQLLEAGLVESVQPTPWTSRALGPFPGETFGDFRLLRELGRGGMGVVHLAEQESMGRQVALKVIRPEILDAPRARERFRREVEAASGLDHPGICTIYEAGDVDGTPYIAMRYAAGVTLRHRIRDAKESGSRSTAALVMDTLRLVEQVARALHYAHERGFIHRDVKPGNVMVTEEGQAVLLDFGLARPEDSTGESITVTGDALGTPAYMSPEQISPRGRPLDRRTDVYSLGVTLFECLTLHAPFEAPTREQLYRQILTTGQADASRHTRNLPRDLHVVLATAMARERDQRYQTALDFAEDLRRVRERKPIAARRPSVVARALSWTRREPVKAALGGMLLLAVVGLSGLGGYLLSRQSEIAAGHRAMVEDEVGRLLARGFHHTFHGSEAVATASFARVLELTPGHPEAIAGRALVHLVQGRGEAALAVLEGAADPALRRARILIRGHLGRGGKEEGEFLGPPETATGCFLAALIQVHAGHRNGTLHEFRRAEELLLEAVLRSPRPQRAYLGELAHVAMHLGGASRIQRIVGALEARWPDEPDVWTMVARAVSKVDPERSVSLWRRVLARHPQNMMVMFSLGNALVKAGDPQEGLTLLDRVAASRPNDSSVLTMRGEALAALGRQKDAIDAYLSATQQAPHQPQAWLKVAGMYLRRGQAAESLALVQRALQHRPDSALLHAQLGRAHVELGQMEAAEGAFRRAVDLDPRSADAWMHLGVFLGRNKRYPQALNALRKAARLDPSSTPYRLDLAACLRDSGDSEAAREEWRDVLRMDHEEPHAHYELGMLSLEAGRLPDAVAHFQVATKRRKNNRHYKSAMGKLIVALLKLGRSEEAVVACQAAIEKSPRDPVPYGQLAELHRLRGEQSEALAVLERVPAELRDEAHVLVVKGKAQADLDQTKAAEATLRRAVDLHPDNGLAWGELGTFLYNRKRYADALPNLRKAVRLRPSSYNRNYLALCLRASGDKKGASDEWRRILDEEPNHADARFQLGWLAMTSKRWAEALEHFQIAAKSEQNRILQAKALINLGLVLRELDRYEESLPVVRRSVALAPKSVMAQGGLGRTLEALGDVDGAIDAYQRALDLNENQPNVRVWLGRLLTNHGRAREGVVHLRATAKRDARWRRYLGQVDKAVAHEASMLKQLADPQSSRSEEELRLLGKFAFQNHRDEEALALYQESFARAPPRRGEMHPFFAARAALRVAGRAGLDEGRRKELHRLALRWLDGHVERALAEPASKSKAIARHLRSYHYIPELAATASDASWKPLWLRIDGWLAKRRAAAK